MPALVPNALCTLLPNAMSAVAFITPSSSRTENSVLVTSDMFSRLHYLPSICTCSPSLKNIKKGLLMPLNINAPANVLGTLPGNDT